MKKLLLAILFLSGSAYAMPTPIENNMSIPVGDARYINVLNDWGCFELNANGDLVMKAVPIRDARFEVNADGDVVMSPIFFDYNASWDLTIIP